MTTLRSLQLQVSLAPGIGPAVAPLRPLRMGLQIFPMALQIVFLRASLHLMEIANRVKFLFHPQRASLLVLTMYLVEMSRPATPLALLPGTLPACPTPQTIVCPMKPLHLRMPLRLRGFPPHLSGARAPMPRLPPSTMGQQMHPFPLKAESALAANSGDSCTWYASGIESCLCFDDTPLYLRHVC
ncbi:hypothetical protein BDV33DRAFT_186019 [Aspergillus novoparasiticus]|uniref:Uncharacterized protein n=1 Tax=Aspergillus novoparasiticus TaxID=986946 RepID=A0A5N6E658_9EURO|nr:hypothetical protein BDV33DRAFT_186019 [Aspergillus novoparasiticus]